MFQNILNRSGTLLPLYILHIYLYAKMMRRRKGCQNASATDPDNMWGSYDSRQPKTFTDILFLKNTSGLYEPQLNAYKPYL